MNTFTQVRGLDGGSLTVEADEVRRDEAVIVVVHDYTNATWCAFDRAGAVELITALTDAVEAADAKDAEKLKAGDVVRGVHTNRDHTVVTDEDEDGMVDVVILGTGRLVRHQPASLYARV